VQIQTESANGKIKKSLKKTFLILFLRKKIDKYFSGRIGKTELPV
jgi:hypothetical protein